MVSRLLQEDDFSILLEDGSLLLLEDSEPEFTFIGTKAVIRPAIGTVNGNNRDFRTPSAFIPGSTVVFQNGFALDKDLGNGWVEKENNWIQMKIAPLALDDVQIYFRPL